MSESSEEKLKAEAKINEKGKKHKGGDVLTRDDFDAGPTNYDIIEPGLILGNLTAAMDIETLELHGVSHILTIDSVPLPRSITQLSTVSNKFIQVTDNPREDLLVHFDDAVDFIVRGMENGVVLVHCYFGVSRSATLVLAYLMKKYSLNYDEAMERILEKRKLVGPNPGFEAQLRLYSEMGWIIDKNNHRFKYFRLSVASDKFRKAKILPQDCQDVIKPDPSLTSVNPEPLVYRCRHCRRVIASASNVFPHAVGGGCVGWQARRSVRRPHNSTQTVATQQGEETSRTCGASLFVEPLAWMTPLIIHEQQGKLHCPKCKSKLGAFSWVSGCQCACGTKQSPAFYLVPSRVDWCTVVQNLQMTV